MTTLLIIEHAKKLIEAMQCLRNEGHHIASLMIVYAAIDQFSWLSTDSEKSTGTDFKNWVDKYMLGRNPFGCTSEELWEARNALLHMGTAESAAHHSGKVKNRIYYTTGPVECVKNNSTNEIIIKIEDLIESFLLGVIWFASEIKSDKTKMDIAIQKIQRSFTIKTL